MSRLLAYLLTSLLLLQNFGQELLVLDYQVRQEQITRLFCVNKARPQLHCNGKCHLAKQLRKAADRESKAPGAGLAKLKFAAVLPGRLTCPAPAPLVARRAVYPRQGAQPYAFSPVHGVFHPPSSRA